MGALLRTCRGALGISITWGSVWGTLFAGGRTALSSRAEGRSEERAP
jgi:hypothetical protein